MIDAIHAFHAFHFLRSYWLLALAPLLGILVILYRYSKSPLSSPDRQDWEKICDPHLLDYLFPITQEHPPYWGAMITRIGLLGSLMIVALAGPTYEKTDLPEARNQSAWMIVLNLSPSMYKTDINPTRMARAQFKLLDFLKKNPDHLFGLIVFSEEAYPIIPLTQDTATLENILPHLTPQIMPTPGYHIQAALQEAERLFEAFQFKNKNILLLTDENANDAAENTAKRLKTKGIYTSVLALQSSSTLQTLAHAGGGVFQTAHLADDDDLTMISQAATATFQQKTDTHPDKKTLWHDCGPFITVLLIPLFLSLLILWKNNLFYFVLLLLLTLPSPHVKANIRHIITEQRAAEALKQGKTDFPDETFSDPRWKAALYYKKMDYLNAQRLLKDQSDEESRYNYANTLAHLGKLKEAINIYEEILHQDHTQTDALWNKKLLEDFLQKQTTQQQKTQKKTPGQIPDHDQPLEQSQPQASDKKQDRTSNNILKNDLEPQKQTASQNQPSLQNTLKEIPNETEIYLRNKLQYEYLKKRGLIP
jgi:Ca-activated chloride channel family protein